MFRRLLLTTPGLVLVMLSSMSCGGGAKVMVPPRVDLQEFRAIALVEFTSNAEGDLDAFASQKFVEALQASQPGVRILEIGDAQTVLEEVDHNELDHRAIRTIGEAYGVDAVIIGDIEVTDVKPTFDFSSMLSGSVQADVEASMSVRLLDAMNGATVWTNSSSAKEPVAHVGINSNGGARFSASDPEDAYGKLVGSLVYFLTDDFRVHYVRK